MRKAVLKLDEIFKLTLISSDKVIAYLELDNFEDVASYIYTSEVSELSILVKGTVSKYPINDASLVGHYGKFNSYISKQDIRAIEELAVATKLKRVKLVDNLGYVLSKLSVDECFISVDEAPNGYSFIVVQEGKIVDYRKAVLVTVGETLPKLIQSYRRFKVVNHLDLPYKFKTFSNISELSIERKSAIEYADYTMDAKGIELKSDGRFEHPFIDNKDDNIAIIKEMKNEEPVIAPKEIDWDLDGPKKKKGSFFSFFGKRQREKNI